MSNKYCSGALVQTQMNQLLYVMELIKERNKRCPKVQFISANNEKILNPPLTHEAPRDHRKPLLGMHLPQG